jgi:hypothetical protein
LNPGNQRKPSAAPCFAPETSNQSSSKMAGSRSLMAESSLLLPKSSSYTPNRSSIPLVSSYTRRRPHRLGCVNSGARPRRTVGLIRPTCYLLFSSTLNRKPTCEDRTQPNPIDYVSVKTIPNPAQFTRARLGLKTRSNPVNPDHEQADCHRSGKAIVAKGGPSRGDNGAIEVFAAVSEAGTGGASQRCRACRQYRGGNGYWIGRSQMC